ncbi:GEVED domain-containing protein [Epilithonimonas sp.]|uniref:GEVED domain-containing protein n=1 Tax=Epilithonimonas sp. TaxID=2894511 RepID=UPI0028B0A0C0|nr:GEVED domain-containing protein [Epilithonimonas sp.]
MKKIFYSFCAISGLFTTLQLKAQSCSAIDQFPYTETFEDDSSTRSCWSQNAVVGNPEYDTWEFATGAVNGSVTQAHNGSKNARMRPWVYTPQSVIKLISPKLDVTALSTPTLSFYNAQEAWGISQNELKVYYRLSENSEWKLLEHYWSNIASWTKQVVSLPEKSTELQIAFEGINNFGRSVVVDDVMIANDGGDTSSSCTPSTPSNHFESGNGDLNALYIANDFTINAYTNLTINQVNLNIIEKGGVDNFDIVFYDSNGFGQPNAKLAEYTGLVASAKTDLNTTESGFTFQQNIIDLPTPAVLKGGANGQKIWMAIKAKGTVASNNLFWESTTVLNSASSSMASGDGVSWQYTDGDMDGVFSLVGECSPSDPTESYCTPSFWYVMPINNVKLADLDNPSSLTSTDVYEDFSSLRADVRRGESYDLEITSITYPQSTQNFTVFIDWNKNGKLNDEGEVYNVGTIYNSTGTDGQTAKFSLPIPLTSELGEVRMRIISEVQEYQTNPCNVMLQGQAEDYTLVVEKEQLSTSEINKAKTSVYPNPTDRILTIKSDKEVRSSELYNVTGQKVISTESKKEVDLLGIAKGIYILKINFKDGSHTSEKIIKK